VPAFFPYKIVIRIKGARCFCKALTGRQAYSKVRIIFIKLKIDQKETKIKIARDYGDFPDFNQCHQLLPPLRPKPLVL